MRQEPSVDATKVERISSDLDSMRRGPVRQVWQKVQQLWELIRDPDAATSAKALAIAALIYLISPIDLVPDPIPVAGLTDDVAVIVATVANLADALRKYTDERRRDVERRQQLEEERLLLEKARRTIVMKRAVGIGGAALLFAAIVAALAFWLL